MRAAGALAALTGVVAVGIARRLAERRDAKLLAPPVEPASAGRRGALAERLDTWVPPMATSRQDEAIVTAWAAPLTVVGHGLARLGGARPRWNARHRCWVATGVGGPSAWVLSRLGMGANTIGQVVLVLGPTTSERLLRHEAAHVRQGERLGVLLPVLYALYSARYGYEQNPFERAARLAE